MVAKFNGKGPDKKAGGSHPNGKPNNVKATPILSKAVIAKARGGSAHINTDTAKPK